MACLKSILTEHVGQSPGTVTLANDVLQFGGYTLRPGGVRGLVYGPFVEYLAARWNLSARVDTDLSLKSLIGDLGRGDLAMVSVHSAIRHAAGGVRPLVRGGHLVLAYSAAPGTISFHNPSGHTSITRRVVKMPLDLFDRFFAGRGVLIAQGS